MEETDARGVVLSKHLPFNELLWSFTCTENKRVASLRGDDGERTATVLADALARGAQPLWVAVGRLERRYFDFTAFPQEEDYWSGIEGTPSFDDGRMEYLSAQEEWYRAFQAEQVPLAGIDIPTYFVRAFSTRKVLSAFSSSEGWASLSSHEPHRVLISATGRKTRFEHFLGDPDTHTGTKLTLTIVPPK